MKNIKLGFLVGCCSGLFTLATAIITNGIILSIVDPNHGILKEILLASFLYGLPIFCIISEIKNRNT